MDSVHMSTRAPQTLRIHRIILGARRTRSHHFYNDDWNDANVWTYYIDEAQVKTRLKLGVCIYLGPNPKHTSQPSTI